MVNNKKKKIFFFCYANRMIERMMNEWKTKIPASARVNFGERDKKHME